MVTLLRALAAAAKTDFLKFSFDTTCEQENVNRIPPGLSCSMAAWLMRL